MKSFSIPVFMSGVGISFALGFAFAWHLIVSDVESDQTAPALAALAVSHMPAAAASGNPVADLWNKNAAQPAPTQQRFAYDIAQLPAKNAIDEQKLRELALSDPIFLRNLIQRYETERQPEMKEAIKSVLATIQKPEALAFFARLANSGDPLQRKDGYAMLQQMAPESPELRQVLKQALSIEQSPEILAQAVAALRPAVVDPAESDAILSQLNNLSQHADAAVRSQSILQLAQWDKAGENQNRITQALADPAPEVRQAAIFAVAQSGTRTDSAKAALWSIIQSPAENRDVKGSALQVLEQFSLSREEYARYVQVRSQYGYN